MPAGYVHARINGGARPTRRGADKVLGEWLTQRGDGRWTFTGEHWLSVADTSVRTCGTNPVTGRDVPHLVPGWLELGPMTAAELAAHVGCELELSPAKTPRARAVAAVPAKAAPRVATLESVAGDLHHLANGANNGPERDALLAAVQAITEVMRLRYDHALSA